MGRSIKMSDPICADKACMRNETEPTGADLVAVIVVVSTTFGHARDVAFVVTNLSSLAT